MKTFTILIAALAVSGCATVIDGTQQTVSLDSNAENASCGISQNGKQIVAPAPVPASHLLPRVSGNLVVTCDAPGYETGIVGLAAGKNPKVFLSMPGLIPGALADTALGGADWYQDRAYVHLLKK